ncbi:MAG: winged helix-turn-helix transcriptional regulator [Nanoarchaeota archaeon]|nr:winged helix-turn-helix transcriptional regulator [Nanoarchaeota archaeon]
MNNIEKLAEYFRIIGEEFKNETVCSMKSQWSIRDIKIIELLIKNRKTMSDLSNHMNLTPGSMTSAIDNLIKLNIVKREFDKDDRRKVYICLSNKGEKIAKDLIKTHSIISKKILNHLNEKEQDEFLSILDKVCKGLENNPN